MLPIEKLIGNNFYYYLSFGNAYLLGTGFTVINHFLAICTKNSCRCMHTAAIVISEEVLSMKAALMTSLMVFCLAVYGWLTACVFEALTVADELGAIVGLGIVFIIMILGWIIFITIVITFVLASWIDD